VTATAPQPPVTSTNGGQAVESAKATTVATADCVTAITARYTPGETLMATPLGEKKFCEGTYRAIYSGVRAQLHLPPGKESYTRHMNCQGIDPATGLVVIAAQEFMRKHIPLEPGLPYGLCFLRTFSEDDGPGEVITTAQDAQFSLGKASRIAADINATTQGHAGPGWVEIKIFKL
jgi:hypothetical protein